jgi:amidohydrolase
MAIPSEIQQNVNAMRKWRQHLHQYPETAFEETDTAAFISEKLRSFGMEVHSGLGRTGVVASLSTGLGERKIALRADMDALFIQEQNDFAYKSRHAGKMHACGHDGHTTMLLGAAQYLSSKRNFNGTVHFIFQPAEEGRAGAKKMIEDGLFDLFPTDCVFGMHNFPEIPLGHFAVKPGPMMAAYDCFEIQIRGQGTHAAMPHLGNDPIIVAAQIMQALQSIISRNTDPADSAVVSITQIHAGSNWNAIPETITMKGTFRCFKAEIANLMKTRICQLVQSICDAFGVTPKIVFNPENPGYPVTMNSTKETQIAAQAAAAVAGESQVNLKPEPSMGAEDFAYMLQEKPGCYIWIGNGPSANSCLLHNPHYDFNDEILPIGAAYWAKLVEIYLATSLEKEGETGC